MHGVYPNLQRLHFKNQLIGAAQSQELLWVALLLWFFYDPTCTNKILHHYQTADVSGTVSMALLSEGQQSILQQQKPGSP